MPPLQSEGTVKDFNSLGRNLETGVCQAFCFMPGDWIETFVAVKIFLSYRSGNAIENSVKKFVVSVGGNCSTLCDSAFILEGISE